MIPVITVEGPTASGKSALALALAEEIGSGIISADSRQVYRHLDIGTAKPSAADRKRVPHHLIDILDPDESYNVGRFAKEAWKLCRSMAHQGKVPIVCGGTGLYIAGLLKGIFPQLEIPAGIREQLRQRISSEGLPSLYNELLQRDPSFARNISANDKQRILRGLEVWQATGTPLSEHWRRQEAESEFKAFRILIDPPREALYDRINHRIGSMLAEGLLDEISSVLAMGYASNTPGLSSLGYKEFIPHLQDCAPLGECAAQAAQHTRNYAKRQCTWNRKHKFDLTLQDIGSIISEIAGRALDALA